MIGGGLLSGYEASADIVMHTVYRAGTAFAGNIVVAVFGFDFLATDIAANGIFDNHMYYSHSFDNATPICTPCTKPDRS